VCVHCQIFTYSGQNVQCELLADWKQIMQCGLQRVSGQIVQCEVLTEI